MSFVVFSRNEELPVIFMFSVVLMLFSYSDSVKGSRFIWLRRILSFSNKVPVKSPSRFSKSGLRFSNEIVF